MIRPPAARPFPARPPAVRSPAVRSPAARWFVAGAAAVCLLGPVPTLPAGPPGEDFDFAAGLYKKGRHAEAAQKFGDFLAEHPRDPLTKPAALFRGFSLYDAGDLAAGRDALRAALQQPGRTDYHPNALLRIGLAEDALGDPDAAVAAFERLREEHPADPLADAALLPLGKARRNAGDLPAAERALRQYLNVTENRPGAKAENVAEARLMLAATLNERGETDAAAAELRRAADGPRPGSDEALRDLGVLEYGRGENRAAAEAFTKLIERNPARNLLADGRINRGYARYKLGENAAAADDLRAAADLAEPERAQLARLWAGRAAAQAGDAEAALADFRIAQGLAPEGRWMPDVLYRWGIVLADSAEPADRTAALAKFERLRAAFPQSPLADDAAAEAARLLLGQADDAFRGGQVAEAAALADRALALDPRAAERPANRYLLVRLDEAALTPDAPDADDRRAALEARYAAIAADPAASPGVRRDAGLRRAASLLTRGEAADAVAAALPIADGLEPGEDDDALRDALRLAAVAASAAGDGAAAAAAGGRFLDLFPGDRRAAELRRVLARNAAAAGDFDAALAAYRVALADGRTPATDRLALKLADWAVDQLDRLPPDAQDRPATVEKLTAAAAELVAPLVDDPATDPDRRAEALALRAWAARHRGRFAEAAADYETIVEQYPDAPVFEEALTEYGVALAQAGDAAGAETALRTAWKRLAPAEPAPAGADARGPLQDAWIAGLERAKLLAVQPGRADDAAAAYAELHAKFPEARPGDVLWQWGVVLHGAGKFDAADELFTRLVEEEPGFGEADQALLLLAEGDLAAVPPRPADAARRLARLVAPAAGEPIKADEAVVRRAGEPYLEALAREGRSRDVIAAAADLAARFPNGVEAAFARLMAAEERVRLAGQNPDEAAALRAAARDDLAAARAELGPDTRDPRTGARPDWLSRPWIRGAELAFLAKDYPEVDRLAEELGAWQPPPPDLYELREIHARRFKQQAPPDFERAAALALSVTSDPAARGTAAADRARVLLGDVALLQASAARTAGDAGKAEERLKAARDAFLRLNIHGASAAMRAQGGLQAGQIEERLGDPARAAEEYRQVIENYPTEPSAALAAEKLKTLGDG